VRVRESESKRERVRKREGEREREREKAIDRERYRVRTWSIPYNTSRITHDIEIDLYRLASHITIDPRHT